MFSSLVPWKASLTFTSLWESLKRRARSWMVFRLEAISECQRVISTVLPDGVPPEGVPRSVTAPPEAWQCPPALLRSRLHHHRPPARERELSTPGMEPPARPLVACYPLRRPPVPRHRGGAAMTKESIRRAGCNLPDSSLDSLAASLMASMGSLPPTSISSIAWRTISMRISLNGPSTGPRWAGLEGAAR